MSIIFNNIDVENVVFNNVELEKVVADGVTVFEKRKIATITETIDAGYYAAGTESGEIRHHFTLSHTPIDGTCEIKSADLWCYNYYRGEHYWYRTTTDYYIDSFEIISDNPILFVTSTARQFYKVDTRSHFSKITVTYKYYV